MQISSLCDNTPLPVQAANVNAELFELVVVGEKRAEGVEYILRRNFAVVDELAAVIVDDREPQRIHAAQIDRPLDILDGSLFWAPAPSRSGSPARFTIPSTRAALNEDASIRNLHVDAIVAVPEPTGLELAKTAQVHQSAHVIIGSETARLAYSTLEASSLTCLLVARICGKQVTCPSSNVNSSPYTNILSSGGRSKKLRTSGKSAR